MGLDSVEIVMAIEDEFKIAISDSDAGQLSTVGKLVDLVYSRLRHQSGDPCPSQHGFYVVRRVLMDRLGLARSAIRPDTKLSNLIGKEDRPRVWTDLFQILTDGKTSWPALVRPKWLASTILIWIPAAAFTVTLLSVSFEAFLLGFFIAGCAALLGTRLIAQFKTDFPPEFCLVKDLIPFVSSLDCGSWTKDEVFEKVRDVAVEQLGLEPEQVTLDASWVYDLGCD